MATFPNDDNASGHGLPGDPGMDFTAPTAGNGPGGAAPPTPDKQEQQKGNGPGTPDKQEQQKGNGPGSPRK